MVLRTLGISPGDVEEFTIPLADKVSWNIRVRDGYDIALRIRFLPNKEGRATVSQPTATLADGRSVKLNDPKPRIYEDYERSDIFRGEIVLSDLEDVYRKEEWDISFLLDNNYSYFTKKTVDLEIITEGISVRPSSRVSGNHAQARASTDRLSGMSSPAHGDSAERKMSMSSERDDRTAQDVFSDSPVAPGRKPSVTVTTNMDDLSKSSSLFATDDPEIARCMEAKAQVDFVWMRCMLKDALRRCPTDAGDLRTIFMEAQATVEKYIDNQFVNDEKEKK